MVDIPTLVRESTADINSLNRGQEKPTFTEGLCQICNAAMELAENAQPTCSQCGMTPEQAQSTNGNRAPAPQQPAVVGGWFKESAADRGNEIYVDIPKTANNHIHPSVAQANDLKQDRGMPRRKPKDIGDFIRQSEEDKKRQVEEAAQEAASGTQPAEQANETPKAEEAASDSPVTPQVQGTPPRRNKQRG